MILLIKEGGITDNYSGKFILDGLVLSGIIEDDSFDCIDLLLKGNPKMPKARTVVEITKR